MTVIEPAVICFTTFYDMVVDQNLQLRTLAGPPPWQSVLFTFGSQPGFTQDPIYRKYVIIESYKFLTHLGC